MRAFFKRPKLKYIDYRTYTCNPVQCLRHNSVTKVVLCIRFINIVLCWQLSIPMWKAICLFFCIWRQGSTVKPQYCRSGKALDWKPYTPLRICIQNGLILGGCYHRMVKATQHGKSCCSTNFYKESRRQIPTPIRFITVWW